MKMIHRLVRYHMRREIKSPYFIPTIILLAVMGILIAMLPPAYQNERRQIVSETDRVKSINNLEKIISESEKKLGSLKSKNILSEEEIQKLESSDWNYIESYKSHLKRIREFTDEEYYYRVSASLPLSELTNALYNKYYDHSTSLDVIKKTIEDGLASDNSYIKDMATNIKNKQVSLVPLSSNSIMLKTSGILNKLMLPLFSALTAVSIFRRKSPGGIPEGKINLTKLLSFLLLVFVSIILIKAVIYIVISAVYTNDGMRVVPYPGTVMGDENDPTKGYRSTTYFKLMLEVQGIDLLFNMFIALIPVSLYLMTNNKLISTLFPAALTSISLNNPIRDNSSNMGLIQVFQYPLWNPQNTFFNIETYYSGFGNKILKGYSWKVQSIYLTLSLAIVLTLIFISIMFYFRRAK